MKNFYAKRLVCLLLFILPALLFSQTKLDFYNEGSSWTNPFPLTLDGITANVISPSNKNSTPQCSNEAWEVSSLGKTYVLSFSSGTSMTIDVGAASTITSITFLTGRNSSGTTDSRAGHYAFSEDDATYSEYVDFTARGYDYCDEITATPVGTNYRYFQIGRADIPGYSDGSDAEFRLFYAIVTVAGGTNPNITTTPSSVTNLYYNQAVLVDATGGNPSSGMFYVDGINLTDTEDLTITPPADFQVSLTGTGGWSSTPITITPSGGEIDSVEVYVRLDPAIVAVNTYSGNITFSHSEDATISDVAVSGEVVNLTPLPCPGTMVVSSETYYGASFSWSNVANNDGYIIKIYELGVQVGSDIDLAANTTSYDIAGLDELTTYTARLTVKGNGTSNGNSVECAAQAFTTLVAPPSTTTTCWTEGFETLAPSANDQSDACPPAGGTSNELRYQATLFSTTNDCDGGPFTLSLPSGLWPNTNGVGACGEGYTGTRSLFARNDNFQLEFPTLDNPRTITLYVNAKQLVTNVARGLIFYLDGAPITTDIYIDDIDYQTIAAVSPGTDGLIRFPSAGWHKVTIELTSTTQHTLTADIFGDSSMDLFIDDITVECASMELVAAPDVAGLNYVADMGPSSIRTFTITASDLPNASGNITLSNLGDFEVSLDNGATWNTTSVALPYTSATFAQSVMVRLQAGLGVADYSTTVAFACPGYTKVLPTLNLSGKVTLLPQTLPCGEEVTLLNMRGTNESAILLDAVTGTDWTAVDQTKNNHFLLSDGASLASPTINLGEYDLKEITFTFQPTNSTSMNMTLSCFGTGGSFTPVTFSGSQKVPYTFTQDLSSTGYTGDFYLTFTDGTETDIEMWDITLTGVPKKLIELSTPSLTGFTSSSVACPSEAQSFMVFGTCLDDDSSLDFTSTLYEFSLDGVTWAVPDGNDVSSLTYTGAYPLGGTKVYVRQRGTASAAAFNASEVVTVTNSGVAANSLLLSGTVSPPDAMVVPAALDYSSMAGVPSTRSFSISGGMSCDPLVVTHNCAGLTLADCEGGTYAPSATFAVTDTLRELYLEYTPGADLNCTLTLTAGSFVETIPLTWTSFAAIANGVAVDAMDLTYNATDNYGTVNVWKEGALPDATIVTITSADFDVSMGDPTYGDFVALTTAELGYFLGALYIRQKAAATSGTIVLAVAGGETTTINVTVQ